MEEQVVVIGRRGKPSRGEGERDKGGQGDKRRGVERRGNWGNVYPGSFPSGEELVGFGNRERLREPIDIVI